MRRVAMGIAMNTLLGVLAPVPAPAATLLVSTGLANGPGNGISGHPGLGAAGAFLAFSSTAGNIVAGDVNAVEDCFYRDLTTGTIERLSVSTDGAEGNAKSLKPVPSVDGKVLTFQSLASNLVADDTNGKLDVFVRDRTARTTRRVSVSSLGVQANGDSTYPQISPNGRYVVFASVASNLAATDPNATSDIFRYDLQTGRIAHVSVGVGNAPANGASLYPAVSGDGRYVAFQSAASNLVDGDTNGRTDIFLRDLQTGLTELISVSSDRAQSLGNSTYPDLSDDGRYVIFISRARNLTVGDTNDFNDLFVRDRTTSVTTRLTKGVANAQINGHVISPEISGNGLKIVFGSDASNLVPGDTNGVPDVFTVVRETGEIKRVSVGSEGQQGTLKSFQQHISQDGAFVVFSTASPTLVLGDTNAKQDVFIAN